MCVAEKISKNSAILANPPPYILATTPSASLVTGMQPHTVAKRTGRERGGSDRNLALPFFLSKRMQFSAEGGVNALALITPHHKWAMLER